LDGLFAVGLLDPAALVTRAMSSTTMTNNNWRRIHMRYRRSPTDL
jgi:hypothetical protein